MKSQDKVQWAIFKEVVIDRCGEAFFAEHCESAHRKKSLLQQFTKKLHNDGRYHRELTARAINKLFCCELDVVTAKIFQANQGAAARWPNCCISFEREEGQVNEGTSKLRDWQEATNFLSNGTYRKWTTALGKKVCSPPQHICQNRNHDFAKCVLCEQVIASEVGEAEVGDLPEYNDIWAYLLNNVFSTMPSMSPIFQDSYWQLDDGSAGTSIIDAHYLNRDLLSANLLAYWDWLVANSPWHRHQQASVHSCDRLAEIHNEPKSLKCLEDVLKTSMKVTSTPASKALQHPSKRRRKIMNEDESEG